MTETTEQTNLLRIFLQSLLKLQNVERGSIWVKRDIGYRCVLALDTEDRSRGIEGTLISSEQPSIVGWVIENGTMTISRASEDRRHYRDIEKDLEIEAELFADCVVSDVAKNLIGIFLNTRSAGRLPRTEGVEPAKIKKVAMLGGGVMGCGIINLLLKAGYETYLWDINDAAV